MAAYQLLGCGTELRNRHLLARGDALEKMATQNGEIVGALAQWRYFQFHYRQAIVEILAKAPFSYRVFKVGGGGGYNAHIHRHDPG
jgi:hypothetical protein